MSIDLSISDNVATILLNRPDKLNALTDTMWIELDEHLARCESDDAIRAVLIAAPGGVSAPGPTSRAKAR